MPPTDPADRFAGTEEYYAAHRPDYADDAIRYLVDRFELTDGSRVLDLGCGAGQLAVALAPHVGSVVGVDPNEAMLREARARADAADVDGVEWWVGSDADLADLADELGPVRLTTMGRAFHWMDQERTLRRLRGMTDPGGGVAIVGDDEWLTKGREDWQAEVYAVAETYLTDLPERVDPGEVEYDEPWDETLRDFGFVDVEIRSFDVEREWDADGIVGYVFSLSFCSPATFGDERASFERELRERLASMGRDRFVQRTATEVVSGRNAGDGSDVGPLA